jgi:hypothetical protein
VNRSSESRNQADWAPTEAAAPKRTWLESQVGGVGLRASRTCREQAAKSEEGRQRVIWEGGIQPSRPTSISLTPSSNVSSGMVLLALRAPPAATASEKAAALTLLGSLTTTTTQINGA